MLHPKHTVKSVAATLLKGFEDGSIVLDASLHWARYPSSVMGALHRTRIELDREKKLTVRRLLFLYYLSMFSVLVAAGIGAWRFRVLVELMVRGEGTIGPEQVMVLAVPISVVVVLTALSFRGVVNWSKHYLGVLADIQHADATLASLGAIKEHEHLLTDEQQLALVLFVLQDGNEIDTLLQLLNIAAKEKPVSGAKSNAGQQAL